jgi:hypothetical protein
MRQRCLASRVIRGRPVQSKRRALTVVSTDDGPTFGVQDRRVLVVLVVDTKPSDAAQCRHRANSRSGWVAV